METSLIPINKTYFMSGICKVFKLYDFDPLHYNKCETIAECCDFMANRSPRTPEFYILLSRSSLQLPPNKNFECW